MFDLNLQTLIVFGVIGILVYLYMTRKPEPKPAPPVEKPKMPVSNPATIEKEPPKGSVAKPSLAQAVLKTRGSENVPTEYEPQTYRHPFYRNHAKLDSMTQRLEIDPRTPVYVSGGKKCGLPVPVDAGAIGDGKNLGMEDAMESQFAKAQAAFPPLHQDFGTSPKSKFSK
jgi:hypothetical protein